MRLFLLIITLLLLSACSSGGGYYQDDGPPRTVSAEVLNTPDAIPRNDPPGAAGNKPYTALGRNYYPVSSARGYVATGSASWYGKKYHGQTTSSGEIYDMYKMTAAHPTLPLPSYVRVTNLQNNKSVVVKVNDRGPFLNNRIIDLSYVAAAKLGIVATGTGQVEVRAVFPDEGPEGRQSGAAAAGRYPPGLVSSAIISEPLADSEVPGSAPMSREQPSGAPVGSVTGAPLSADDGAPSAPRNGAPQNYLQVGVFSQSVNADSLLKALRSRGFNSASIRTREGAGGQNLFEVSVGPLSEWEKQDTAIRLKELGYQPFLVIK
jgi:rare lipoprotein A